MALKRADVPNERGDFPNTYQIIRIYVMIRAYPFFPFMRAHLAAATSWTAQV
jgi:hypothetical protein